MKVKIEGLDCPNCAKTLERHINNLGSVKSANINFLKSYIEFESENENQAINDIISLTAKIEPDAKIIYSNSKGKRKWSLLIDFLVLLFGIGIGLFALYFKPLPVWAFWTMYVVSALVIGYKTYYKALRLLLKGTINENMLITLSVIGAAAVGERFDGLMVVSLYTIGKILEGLAINKSKKSIEELTNFKPEYAMLITKEGEKRVLPSQLKIGDEIMVRPGEKVPVDGIIIEGNASLDMQSLTGESLPSHAGENNEILSGSIVLDGTLKIRVAKEYRESTVNKIIDLIENATEKKSKAETVISKITRWYTLGVIICAVLVWGIVWAVTANFSTAIYRGLIFLVVSCPCAFAISVPLAYFSGLGNASKQGILIKGSNFLDSCAKLNMIAFDKTGTLTTGTFEIKEILSCDEKLTKEDILYLASLGEQYSLHPLAKSIVNACQRELIPLDNVKEIAGEGVQFTFENKNYFVGRRAKDLSGTVVEVYEEDRKLGQIVLADKIKPNSKYACELLKSLNVKTIMLSGDNNSVAQNVAKEIGLDEYYGQLLPQDKFNYIEKAKGDAKNKIGYVGDGLNDAPSLTLADVGFSMGIKGNSASIEASDVVIATDNIEKVAQSIKISKYTRAIVWQNIILSALIKVVFLTLGACGVTGMLEAVIADVGVTLVAILNSLRALHYKPYKKEKVKECDKSICESI